MYSFRFCLIFNAMALTSALNIIWTPSPNFGPRIIKSTGQVVDKPTILVMHYTVADLDGTIKIFQTKDSVSAHYTVAKNGTIYQHVKEEDRAWHAGAGSWGEVRDVNTYSIGIEHENAGYKDKPGQPDGVVVDGSDLQWYPFSDPQIEASIELAKDIVQRYNISPLNVIGHHDVAPTRKWDPGPLFPWKKYFENDIGAWVDDKSSGCYISTDIGKFQKKLIKLGYTSTPSTGQLDNTTRSCVRAFQMHFRQNNISGDIDEESAIVLDNLLDKYSK